MKEKNFKVTETIAEAIKAMDDRTAGKFIKSISDYAFHGKIYEGNDPIIKSNFTLVKRVIDGQEQDKYYGKLGGVKSLELRNKDKEKISACKVLIGDGVIDGLMNELFSTLEGSEKKTDGDLGKQ